MKREQLIKKLDAFNNMQINYANQLTDVIDYLENYILEEVKIRKTQSFEEVARDLKLYDILEEMCSNLSEIKANHLNSYIFNNFFGIEE